jgi:hypothetical protein
MRAHTSEESWAWVSDWEHLYQVSSHGRVQSVDRIDANGQHRRGRMLRQCDDGAGYLCVSLKRDGKQKHCRVHALVARAFWGRSPGQQVRHLDGEQSNNSFDNLCWGSSRENAADKKRHGTLPAGDRCHFTKYNGADFERISDLRRAGKSQAAIAAHLGIGQSHVSRVLRGAARRNLNQGQHGSSRHQKAHRAQH